MMLLIRTIRYLWPFLQEMFLGGKTLKEALRLYFFRVMFIGLFMLSIAVNFLTVPKAVQLSYDLVALKHKHASMVRQCWPNSEPEDAPIVEHESAAGAESPAAVKREKASSAPVTVDEHFEQTQEWVHRLQARESKS